MIDSKLKLQLMKFRRKVLRAELNDYVGPKQVGVMVDDTATSIKQAFKDDGWLSTGLSKDTEDVLRKFRSMMTGAEWYDRFISEGLKISNSKSEVMTAEDYIDAAERASVMHHDEEV